MVVTALLVNGATCVGNTIMDEFGLGVTGENLHYGTPTNPKVPSHIPGGSSSGSAVVVAVELVDFAIGTDTTGCNRVPAACCGVLGFRPSHGAISTIGILPVSQRLDSIVVVSPRWLISVLVHQQMPIRKIRTGPRAWMFSTWFSSLS
ncbi:outer envelope protein 64, mitochondrial [Nicotiana attenuata]|uniref:Outer envelope protein 64, mitochondrial n=1 Tax=Nicotiana attenuata TaxID=49451 RepID=A0A314LA19_NICAT|nr:outer envelope protein 64, mitochondrial [Nicotiana attenuata]